MSRVTKSLFYFEVYRIFGNISYSSKDGKRVRSIGPEGETDRETEKKKKKRKSRIRLERGRTVSTEFQGISQTGKSEEKNQLRVPDKSEYQQIIGRVVDLSENFSKEFHILYNRHFNILFVLTY